MHRRLSRLLKDAQLRIAGACLEDVDTSAVRGLDKAMVWQLGSCAWVGEHLNVLATGATGVGKSSRSLGSPRRMAPVSVRGTAVARSRAAGQVFSL